MVKEQLTQKEKQERKSYYAFKDAFEEFWSKNIPSLIPKHVIVLSKKVSQTKYSVIAYNQKYHCLCIYLNQKIFPDLKKKTIILTAKRMALKLYLISIGRQNEIDETSKAYAMLAKKYYLWNYGPYPETPQKWYVYSCSICGNNLAVFAKPLPTKNDLVHRKTPPHTRSLKDTSVFGGSAHQGTYAFKGHIELSNPELQKVLFTMNKINIFEEGEK